MSSKSSTLPTSLKRAEQFRGYTEEVVRDRANKVPEPLILTTEEKQIIRDLRAERAFVTYATSSAFTEPKLEEVLR